MKKIDRINGRLLVPLAWIFGILTVALVVFYAYVIVKEKDWTSGSITATVFEAMKKNPGDLSWGSLGILLTVETFILMLLTFRTQKRQLDEQHATQYATMFEGTFYNLLSMFYNVRQQTNRDIEAVESSSVAPVRNIEELTRRFLQTARSNRILMKETEDFKEGRLSLEEQDNLVYMYGEAFSKFLTENGYSLSYYFRYISNLIDYVIRSWEKDEGKIHRYLNFIQAQMSDAELCLLFYNCLSVLSKNHDHQYAFFNKLNRYSFLENISERWLVDRSNHKFYDTTEFKFLSGKEQESKRLKQRSLA